MQYLLFTIGEQLYAIPASYVREIMLPDTLTPIPKASSYVEGLFKPRDIVITVYSLSKLIGVETHAKHSLFIVLESDTFNYAKAFRVDSVLAMVTQEETVPHPLTNRFSDGLFEYQGKIVNVLAMDTILKQMEDEKEEA